MYPHRMAIQAGMDTEGWKAIAERNRDALLERGEEEMKLNIGHRCPKCDSHVELGRTGLYYYCTNGRCIHKNSPIRPENLK